METVEKSKPFFSFSLFLNDNALLCYLAIAKLFIHLAVNLTGGYGYFRDEFYYIACSNHMAWGYVDQPPFSIAALWVSRLFFGDSIFALRLLPAIAGAVTVALAGLMTRELGGKRFAQMLASVCVIFAPLTLGTNSVFSMNSFDVLLWSLSFYLIIIILKREEKKRWLLLGVVLGLGLLNKISVLWLCAGFGVGLILTPNRRWVLTLRFWIAPVAAVLLFLPHILWQVAYHFPTLEFIRNATANKYVSVSPLEMFIQQLLNMNPLTLPIWLAGLMYFLFSKSLKQFRILPFIYIIVFLILVINKNSKSEYLGSMIPMLFAAGAFTFEKFILKYNWRFIRPIAVGLITLSGIALTPFAIAVLPVETFIAYSHALGIAPSTPEKKEIGKLPQFYADMFGWDKLTSEIGAAYNKLTPEEKKKCAIIGNNYGEAGAIDFFGPKYSLPKAISGHNNYWLWGPRGATGEVVIRFGGNIEAMLQSYKEVKQVGFFKDEYYMPYENNMPIYVCKYRLAPLQEDWKEFKHYE